MARNREMRPDNGGTACSTCGAAFPVNPPGHCGGTGYAVKPDGARICYPCAAEAERAAVSLSGSVARTAPRGTGGTIARGMT
jgi:hypothetical protein